MSYTVLSLAEYGKLSIEEMQEVIDSRNRYLIETLKGHTIETVIKMLTEIYLVEQEIPEPADINDGSCWEFAEDLKKIFPEGEIWNNQEMLMPIVGNIVDWDHCFFLYRGRYYDSECPQGTEDWSKLPCCARCIA